MRYLTKQWSDLHKLTNLHAGLRVHKEAKELSERTYLRLRQRKLRTFLKQERELHDFDPRTLLEEDNTVFVRADKFFSGEVIQEEDTIIYEMSNEEKVNIHQLIEAYDKKQPFNVQECKSEFDKRQRMIQEENKDRIPGEIYSKIADPRVFALGYSTREIIEQLKKYGQENEKIIQSVLDNYSKEQQAQQISDYLKEIFGFHDCKVLSVIKQNDITIDFDSSHGFTTNNRVIFHDAVVIQEDREVDGAWWIYEEVYKNEHGYEVHMLFADHQDSKIELTIVSKDITIDRVDR